MSAAGLTLSQKAAAQVAKTPRQFDPTSFPEEELRLAVDWATGRLRTFQVCLVVDGSRRHSGYTYSWLSQRLRAAVRLGLLEAK